MRESSLWESCEPEVTLNQTTSTLSTQFPYSDWWDIEASTAKNGHEDGIDHGQNSSTQVAIDGVAIVDIVVVVSQVKNPDVLAFP